MHFNKSYRTFPLRTTLVISVLTTAFIIVLICLGIAGYPAYSKAKKEIYTLWEKIGDQAALNAKEAVVAYFENAPATLKMVEGLVAEEQLLLSSSEAIFDICYRMLKENPEFVTAYYFKPDGTFYGVLRDAEGFQATFRVVDQEKTKEENYRIGPNHQWILFETLGSNYDPRNRPFWKSALAHPEGGWSEVYDFAETGAKGFTYVLAHPGNQGIDGYWAVDFQVNLLSQFLHTLKVGKEGSVYIVTPDGALVAESSIKDVAALQRYLESDAYTKRRIFSSVTLPKDLGIDWKIITIIHENDFLKPIRSHAGRSLAVGLFFTAIFLVVTALFFGKVSERLKEMALEMDEAGQMIFNDRSVDSLIYRIRELNMMNHALHKMKAGLQSFSKYIPVDIVKKLLHSGQAAKPGAEKKPVTALFIDLAHFTSMAEALPSDEVVHILGEFLTTVTDAVDSEKGMIDKFIGDAAMALWGTPQPIPDPAVSACRAALAIKKRLSSNFPLDFRIGINTGVAMVGNFGSTQRLDYTAIGDAINIASRLEKLNKFYGTKILIGPSTAEEVKGAFLIRPIDSVLLEGRTRPLVVYELFGLLNETSESIEKGLSLYSRGLDAYLAHRLSEAAPLFEEADRLLGGNDAPSKKLLERIRASELP